MLVYLVDSLKEHMQREEVASLSEQQFLGDFLERYLLIPASYLQPPDNTSHLRGPGRGMRSFRLIDSGVGNLEAFKPDLSLIERIIDHVTLFEWFTVSKDIVKFHKSKLTQDISIDDTLYTTLQYMNENGLSFLALLNPEKKEL
jgi:hypothetical protein